MENLQPPPSPTAIIRKKDDASRSLFVVDNSLIVSKILSFLPISDVKRVRRVSSLWNDEALKILKKRARINFPIDEICRGFLETLDFIRFFTSCQLMGVAGGKKSSIPIWKVVLPSYGSLYPNHNIGDKLYDDLQFFLNRNFGLVQWIKVLDLNITITWPPDFELVFDLLENIQPTLEELHLSGSFRVCNIGPDYNCRVNLSFPKLQRFTCGVYIGRGGGDEDEDDSFITLGDWWNSVIIGAKGVKTLTIGGGFKEGFVLRRLSFFSNLEELAFEDASDVVVKTFLTDEQIGKLVVLNRAFT